jgi:DNA-binding PucR family transcriptional regulator
MAMTQNDRERQHRARLAQIDAVQVVAGNGDEARVNHERTLIERARMFAEELASHEATERGLSALDRLLAAIEAQESPHLRDTGHFIEALWNNKPLALSVLRAVDKRTADDMMDVLDGWRYARVNLCEHVKGGPRRIALVLRTCRA